MDEGLRSRRGKRPGGRVVRLPTAVGVPLQEDPVEPLTLLCVHPHPDDEAIATGGTMARASDEGHRVVLVVATDGIHGERPDDLEDVVA